MRWAALGAFALGAPLLMLVENTAGTLLGVLLLLAAIVLGTFAVANPELLAPEADDDD
jgi:hypothetical protein